MKLELKHLAPYFPYGLIAKLSRKGIFNLDAEIPNEKANNVGIVKNISFFGEEITGQLYVTKTYSFDFEEIDEIDVLLRPLSDLTKEIEVNGEKFVPIEWFEIGDDENLSADYGKGNMKLINLLEDMSKYNVIQLGYLQYGVVEKLLQWHFDIFQLIPQKLAIDINTLEI
ncbi:MAG: hypothetical protein RLZZ605_1453 [Bacteroidota bacterium]|jgi:hypothetical protein